MYVYSNIVKLSSVGNSQIPKGFLLIKSRFKKMVIGYLTNPCISKSKHKNLNTSTMKILTEINDQFFTQDRLVTCRLYFRRRPFLA